MNSIAALADLWAGYRYLQNRGIYSLACTVTVKIDIIGNCETPFTAA